MTKPVDPPGREADLDSADRILKALSKHAAVSWQGPTAQSKLRETIADSIGRARLGQQHAQFQKGANHGRGDTFNNTKKLVMGELRKLDLGSDKANASLIKLIQGLKLEDLADAT